MTSPSGSAVVVALAFAASTVLSMTTACCAVIFTDSFTGGASASWGNEVGSWSASGGVYDAQLPNNSPITYSSLPFNLQDFSVELDINNVQDGGVWLRSSDYQNGVLLVTGANGGNLYWHVISGGVVSPGLGVASGIFTPGVSDPHLRITAQGSHYSVFVDGAPTPATTLTDATFTSGKVALYDFSAQTFDNVSISVPEPGEYAAVAGLALTAFAAWRRRSAS